MLRSDLHDFSDVYILVKGTITVTNLNNAKRNKAVAFKNNAPFINCISKFNGVKIDNAEDLNVVKITEKQQEVCGIIIDMNQVIHFLLILNLLNIKQALQEMLIMLVIVKKDKMQIKLVKMKLKLLLPYNI